MKGFRFLTGGFVFVLIFSALAFAQTEKTQSNYASKIGFINSEAFDNKETGIKEIVETNEKLEAEFKPQIDELKAIAEKIQNQQEEFKKAGSGYWDGPIPKEKLDKSLKDYESDVCKYKTRTEEIKSQYDKRKSEIFADVYKKVRDTIKQFAKEKGYLIVLDSSKDNSSAIIEGETIDITKEFIKYYNENIAKSKSQ
jgi:Skp family chaperone for outer membrane proteins